VAVESDSRAAPVQVLRIVVSEHGTARTTIALAGEWDLAQRDAVRQAVRRSLAPQPDRLVLDLSRLSFIDTSGVQGTIDLAARAARLKIGLEIVPGPRAVQRLFEICQLAERLPFTRGVRPAG
jgi:anti-sigma B factor antagonist